MKTKLIIVLLVVLGIAFWMVSLAGGFGTGGDPEADRQKLTGENALPGWVKSLSFLGSMPRLTLDDVESLTEGQISAGNCRREGDTVVLTQKPSECYIEIPPLDDFHQAVLSLESGPPVTVNYKPPPGSEQQEDADDSDATVAAGKEVTVVFAKEGGGELKFQSAPSEEKAEGPTIIRFKE